MSRRLAAGLLFFLKFARRGARGYLTEHDVMEQTGASPADLRGWERRGLLRPYARPGQNLYRQEQLEVVRWLMREERLRRRPLPPAGENPGPTRAPTLRQPS